MLNPTLLPRPYAERLGRLTMWMTTDLRVSSSERVLLAFYCVVGDEHLNSFWSQPRISDETGMGVRTVRDATKRLVKRGLIMRTPRKRPDGGRSSDVVRVVCPAALLELRLTEKEKLEEGGYAPINPLTAIHSVPDYPPATFAP